MKRNQNPGRCEVTIYELDFNQQHERLVREY